MKTDEFFFVNKAQKFELIRLKTPSIFNYLAVRSLNLQYRYSVDTLSTKLYVRPSHSIADNWPRVQRACSIGEY